MSYNRRKFLASLGTATATGLLLQSPLNKIFAGESDSSIPRPHVAVFYDPSFPAIGEITLSKEHLVEGLKGCDVTFMTAGELTTSLNVNAFDLFVNPSGSAFPFNAYDAIHAYLLAGGNWLNLGGTPLAIPVARSGESWRPEARQTTYHRQVGITQSFPVDVSGVKEYLAAPDAGDFDLNQNEFTATQIDELYCRFTSSKDYPAEDGSAGPRDAVLRSLCYAVNDEKIKIAAPFIVIERLLGDYAGGRWVFATMTGTLTPKAISQLVHIATASGVEFTIAPSFAAYRVGEVPSFYAHLKKDSPRNLSIRFTEVDVILSDERNQKYDSIHLPIKNTTDIERIEFVFHHIRQTLPAGLYHISGILKYAVKNGGEIRERRTSNGFWIYDETLLSSKNIITADQTYLYRDGKPYPVTGTTYMASDVHRKFLFEPNPFLWNRDFGAMKDAGINMVRTGIWTGWKNMMFDAGAPSEVVLRAIDAYVLTAIAHDMPIIFTLFAFLPESWGGENPYLDPRSVDAQKKFVTAITSRYRDVNLIIWDIINEPSFCNPAHLWETKPNYDRFEREAWRKYLAQRLTSPDDLFRELPGGSQELPALADFEDVAIYSDRHPIKAMEYKRFAQVMFFEWVQKMREAIRFNGNRNQLITVGQDEGGTGESPNNHSFAGALNFTSVHNWWLNDDLLWDSVVTGVGDKPNLVEETGVMFYETANRNPWRSEEEVSRLLERKLAVSFAAGGAGFVEWLWNTNPYMNSDNEAAIGLLRVDGTAKPELEPVRRYAKFFRENARLMADKVGEEVGMVIPYANQFSPRSTAAESTKRSVRTIMVQCHLPMISVSEDLRLSLPKLTIYPSPGNIPERFWQDILTRVEVGGIIFISGVIETDDYWMHIPRLKSFDVSAHVSPISQEEVLVIDQKRYYLDFRGDKMQKVQKAVVDGESISTLHAIPHGKGTIYWSPLPVELSDTSGALASIYSYILQKAGIEKYIEVENETPLVAVVPVIYKKSILCTLISETDQTVDVRIKHLETSKYIDVTVKGGRTALIWIERSTGNVISRLT